MATTRCDYWWKDDVKYSLAVVTPPALDPVTVDEAKQQCQIFHDDEDTWFEDKISAARELCETFVKRAFIGTVLRLKTRQFPQEFYLPRPRLIRVQSLKYYDSAGVQQTISSSNYIVDTDSEPGIIVPISTYSWPSAQDRPGGVEVVYDAGYGSLDGNDVVSTADDVPSGIKDAILMTVAQWYVHRGDDVDSLKAIPTTELPRGAKSQLRANSWGYLP